VKVDLVIATYNRAGQLRETLRNVLQYAQGLNRIYVVNNGCSDNTDEVLREFTDETLVVLRSPVNLGAAAGKNVGLRRSDADIIIVIDDDAEFCTADPVARVRELFGRDERLGIAQFKIINCQSRTVLRYEFPGDDPEHRSDETFDIGYFVGAGHAIRKRLLDEVGYYPDDFGLYAHEEVDLSYRAVNGGYVMRYAPCVGVLHKKDPGGRLPPAKVLYQLFYNRLIMSHRYLPLPYSVICNCLWFLRTAVSARSVALPYEAWREYSRRKPLLRRDVLSPTAIAYLRSTGGRLFR